MVRYMMPVLKSSLLVYVLLFLSCSGASESSGTLEVIKSSSESQPRPIKSIAFSDSQNLWLLIDEDGLLRTADGGTSWEKHKLSGLGTVKSITFINKNQGWLVNDQAQVFRTGDGGRSWDLQATLDYRGMSIKGPVMQIFFVDDQHGWALDPFSIWRTENGGMDWQRIKPPMNKHLFHFQFIDSEIGWISAAGGLIYATQDGGKTWQANLLESKDADVRTVFFIDERLGWSSLQPKEGIYASRDNGKTWYKQFRIENAIIRKIQFINQREGWAIGSETIEGHNTPFDTRGLALHTRDGGETWEVVESLRNNKSYDHIYFADEQHGWLIAYDNILRTDNNGRTWNQVLSVADK